MVKFKLSTRKIYVQHQVVKYLGGGYSQELSFGAREREVHNYR